MSVSRTTGVMRKCVSAVFVALFCILSSVMAEDVKISGIVRDPAGRPLGDTVVQAKGEEGLLLGEDITDTSGHYAFFVKPGKPIVRVVYNNTRFHPRTVEELSREEGDNHVINKVLPVEKGPQSFEVIVDQIMVYDRLRIVEQFARRGPVNLDESRAALREEYGKRILNIPHPLRRNRTLRAGQTVRLASGEVAMVLLDLPQMESEQKDVIDKRLTSNDQKNVVNRLMGDLLWRYGYTDRSIAPAINENQSP